MDLFGKSSSATALNRAQVARIEGLELHEEFVSPQEEQALLRAIHGASWLPDLSRKVQHYGYKYDYRARSIDATFRLGDLPDWLGFVSDRMKSRKIIDFDPDQAIMNHYEPGQGIAPHIDCEPCFDDVILSLSLGDDVVMEFRPKEAPKEKIPVLLPRRSLVVMKGASRYLFLHGIAPRKSDAFAGAKRARSERISVTFRKVILK